MADCLNQTAPKSESVKVVVRCRPMTEKELGDGHQPIVEMDTEQGIIELRSVRPSTGVGTMNTSLNASTASGTGAFTSGADTLKQFTFDAVYDWNSKQSDIYDEVMRPLVNSVLEGFNGTIFAYGQTGTGKTYTMEGVRDDPERKGVIPNSFSQIFSHIARTTDKQYLVRASYLEIYQEEIRDLLAKDQTKRLELKERADVGVYVKDLSSFVCKSIKEIEHVMTIGNQNRSVGATNMNEHSSRSHAIFIITIEHSDVRSMNLDANKHAHHGDSSVMKTSIGKLTASTHGHHQTTGDADSVTDQQTRLEDGSGESMVMDLNESKLMSKVDMPLSNHIRVGKLNLVDLAGSERQIKTGTTGKRQKEAIKINLSLSALGNVISALVDGKSTHIPYRDSKLTRLLQDSLGGNAKTVMIAAIGPASYNYEETLTTLRYASRAKCIRNKPRVNEDPKDALLRAFQLEIERLKYLLSIKRKPNASNGLNSLVGSTTASSQYGTLTGDDEQMLTGSGGGGGGGTPGSALDAEMLANRIKQMESKLLRGGRNIVDHTNEQQRELDRKAQEIAEQKQREREWKQMLAEQEENTLEIRDTCSTLQQEVDVKKRKLRKLFAKMQNVRSEVRDSLEANARERRELEELQSELLKELKLKYIIIDNFVAMDDKNRLLARLRYDEERDEWQLQPKSAKSQQVIHEMMHKSRFEPLPAVGVSNPISRSANHQTTSEHINEEMLQMLANANQVNQGDLGSTAVNHKLVAQHMIGTDMINSNLVLLPVALQQRSTCALLLHLLKPDATTKTLEEPVFNDGIEMALETALSDLPEITINARQASVSKSKVIDPLMAIDQLDSISELMEESNVFDRRPKTAGKNHSVIRTSTSGSGHDPQSMFPKAKGLVRR